MKPFAELIIGYANEGRSLHEFDPRARLVQWPLEPAGRRSMPRISSLARRMRAARA